MAWLTNPFFTRKCFSTLVYDWGITKIPVIATNGLGKLSARSPIKPQTKGRNWLIIKWMERGERHLLTSWNRRLPRAPEIRSPRVDALHGKAPQRKGREICGLACRGGREREGSEEWLLACVDLPARPSAFFPFPLPFSFLFSLLSGGLQQIGNESEVQGSGWLVICQLTKLWIRDLYRGKGGKEVWLSCHGEDAPWAVAVRGREEEEGDLRGGVRPWGRRGGNKDLFRWFLPRRKSIPTYWMEVNFRSDSPKCTRQELLHRAGKSPRLQLRVIYIGRVVSPNI
jgi:hypothetical protein